MKAVLSGEMLKLLRQPGTLFWGFLAVPLAATLLKLIIAAFVYLRMGGQADGNADVFLSAARSLSISGNSLGHLLFAMGIASVFFIEYRYATWRLLVPRHARSQLFVAKLVTCLAWLTLSLLLAVVGDMVLTVLFGLLQGQGLDVSVASLFTLIMAFGIGFLELGVLAALVALLVVTFRSMIGGVIPAFLLAIGSTLLHLYFGADADRLPLPSYAAEALRGWLLAGGPPSAAMLGFLVLLLWAGVLTGLGLLVFSRQQLAAE
jgi:Flp pilus assembly pilin Flp